VILTSEQQGVFYRDGYLHVPDVVPRERVERALSLINRDLERGIDPARLSEFYARSFCPDLRNVADIIDLFEQTPARALADALVAPGTLRRPAMAQIALRFPDPAGANVLPRPHVDGTYGPKNGVKPGQVAHFTLLAMVALSDVQADFNGNFTVWPGTHHAYERYFQGHGAERMLEGTPRLDHLPEPVQTRVRAGDVVLAHYELGHAAAPNLGSNVRYAIFFRLYHRDHDPDALDILSDIWREYPTLAERAARASTQ
jgi:Phytanoyl-CoA dioxygenase (PhyH)